MARLLRIQFSGAIYHVTVRGNERRRIFKDDKDRERFLKQLAEARELHGVRVYLVCLMPNHFHLLVETPAGNVSAFMGRLLTSYVVYYNRRHGRVGHLTQGRYKAQLVEGNDYLVKLTRYIHLNPVCGKRWEGVSVEQRRERLRTYQWSTYRSYAGLEAAWSLVDYGPVRALVEQLGVSYAAYVEAGLAETDEQFGALYRVGGMSLGSDEFEQGIREAHQRAARKARRPEDIAFRRGVGSHRSVAETLAAVAAAFQVPESALHGRRRNSAARGAAAWALVRHAGLTERAAGEILGMGTGSAVSQQLAKWRRDVSSEARYQAIEKELERQLANANF